MIGADGNIFYQMRLAARTLRSNGLADEAKAMCSRVMASGSYEEALGVLMDYVTPVAAEPELDGSMM